MSAGRRPRRWGWLVTLALLALPGGAIAEEDPFARGPPPVAAPAPLRVPVPEVYTLSDGTPVWLVRRPEVPLVHIAISLQRGLLDAAQPAAVALASTLLDEGTVQLPGAAWSDAVDGAGAEIEVRLTALSTRVHVDSLAGREEESLSLALAAMLDPILPARRLRQARQEAVVDARDAWLAPGRLHDLAVQRSLYGPDHPLGAVVGADELAGVSRRVARRAWRDHLEDAAPAVVVVGATSADEILPVLERTLARLPGAGEATPAPLPLDPPARGPRHVLVDSPDLQRAFVSVLVPTPGLGHPDQPALDLLERAVAGEFDSRLSRLLREERGWTYAVHGQLRLWPGHGLLEVRCAVDAQVTPAALVAIERELVGLVEHPPDEAELALAQAAVRRDAALDLLSDRGLASYLAIRQSFGLPADAAAAELRASAAVDRAELAGAAARSLDVGRATWVITGDRVVIEPLLDAAELPLDAIRGGRSVVDGAPPLPL